MPAAAASSAREILTGLPIWAFADAEAWIEWLAAQDRASPGVWLKLAKKGNPASRLTKHEAIDAALIHGWIDGQLNPYDDAWWLTRFTPRRPRSKWSEVNRTRATELIGEGRMAQAGLAEIEAAKADGRWAAAYPPASTAVVPDDLAAALDANSKARAFFETLTGVSRYAVLYRMHDAKLPATRAARIAKFVALLGDGNTIG